MELRHLRYFVTLAEELHFGRAADRLHIAQPPLSQQIRQLELELGFQLFHRTKRTVRLTEAGQVFLAEVQQILNHLDRAIQTGRQTSRGEIGQLVIGFVSSAAYNVLPKLLACFRAAAPEVTIALHELTTDQQLDWLREGRIDIGFLRPPVKDVIFDTATIFRESLVLALPENHPLTQHPLIPLRSLSQESFIVFPRSFAPNLYDTIISLCQQAGFSPTVVQEAIQMQTIVSLVAANLGIAIVPASLQHLQRTGVVYKAIEETVPEIETVMAWRRSEPSLTVQRFLEAGLRNSKAAIEPVSLDNSF